MSKTNDDRIKEDKLIEMRKAPDLRRKKPSLPVEKLKEVIEKTFKR